MNCDGQVYINLPEIYSNKNILDLSHPAMSFYKSKFYGFIFDIYVSKLITSNLANLLVSIFKM